MYKRIESTLFKKGSFFHDVRDHQLASIKSYVHGLRDAEIQGSNENDLATQVSQKFFIDFPEVYFDQTSVEQTEELIPTEFYRSSLHRDFGPIKRNVIKFRIPTSGEIKVLEFMPSTFSIGGGDAFSIHGRELIIQVIDLDGKPETARNTFERAKQAFAPNYDCLRRDVGSLNNELNSKALIEVRNRKAELQSKNSYLADLGFPLKNSENVPSTYTVPPPVLKPKINIETSGNTKVPHRTTPRIDDKTYFEILKRIDETGKTFERLPAVYSGKSENNLRDHILLNLAPSFDQATSTGETFSVKGKTDILIKYGADVLFIAECKFWTGPIGLQEAISQLLGYLTFRDSKISLIVFVETKGISAVLQQIDNQVLNHSNFLRKSHKTSDHWFNYVFHLNGDPGTEIQIAILTYHLPN